MASRRGAAAGDRGCQPVLVGAAQECQSAVPLARVYAQQLQPLHVERSHPQHVPRRAHAQGGELRAQREGQRARCDPLDHLRSRCDVRLAHLLYGSRAIEPGARDLAEASGAWWCVSAAGECAGEKHGQHRERDTAPASPSRDDDALPAFPAAQAGGLRDRAISAGARPSCHRCERLPGPLDEWHVGSARATSRSRRGLVGCWRGGACSREQRSRDVYDGRAVGRCRQGS
mmetsp:Transcript_30624/g.76657  ORF Transcript_30624/g.76657 Transcript_30624/m.76657 type:complete len:230 (-) Transcript_30624:590-1279(-)